MLSVGLCVQIACVWEATARKPGNVHAYAGFADLTYTDFLLSAAAIAPVLDSATSRAVGETVLKAMQATRQVLASNTNLGIVLLLTPLAAVPRDIRLERGVDAVLNRLDVHDASAVFEAIRLATPGGLGRVPEQDVTSEPTVGLREVMRLAAGRDAIAAEYANGFQEVLGRGVAALREGIARTGCVESAIVCCHLRWMSCRPDSLIARKCGPAEAEAAGKRAAEVLEMDWPHTPESWKAFHHLDAWLRAEGNRRNPGTSADLVTACLFVLLREGEMTLPLRMPWSAAWVPAQK